MMNVDTLAELVHKLKCEGFQNKNIVIIESRLLPHPLTTTVCNVESREENRINIGDAHCIHFDNTIYISTEMLDRLKNQMEKVNIKLNESDTIHFMGVEIRQLKRIKK